MWKKRKKNRKRKVGAAGYVRDPERKLRFFFSRPCTFEPPPASPTRFSEIIDVKITGKDDSAFIVLRSNMVNGAPGTAKISTRVYDSSGLLPVFPAEPFPSVDFDTMISVHAVGTGYVIVSICEDKSRNCIH